ncbi:MAG TPA: STAS domain-containing protein [Thermoleophilaceae bacterium]|nr:STAS domain-containing protein [Thermoleophilaceae bacterium]
MSLPNRSLRILTAHRGHTVRIAVFGELDRGTLLPLSKELEQCDRGPASVFVIDLAALEFLDGASFRMLLEFGRRLRRRGRHLTLVNPSPQVRRILAVAAMVHEVDVLDEWLEEPAER